MGKAKPFSKKNMGLFPRLVSPNTQQQLVFFLFFDLFTWFFSLKQNTHSRQTLKRPPAPPWPSLSSLPAWGYGLALQRWIFLEINWWCMSYCWWQPEIRQTHSLTSWGPGWKFVYPMGFIRFLYMLGGCLGFLIHQQYVISSPSWDHWERKRHPPHECQHFWRWWFSFSRLVGICIYIYSF